MSEVTVPVKPNGHNTAKELTARVRRNAGKTLEDFARGIEAKLKQGAGPDAVANHICRLLASKDEHISALMWCKWVEWRYGKAREHIEHSIVDHTATIEQAKRLARRMLEIDAGDNAADNANDKGIRIIDNEPR